MMKKIVIAAVSVFAMVTVPSVWASGNHHHADGKGMEHSAHSDGDNPCAMMKNGFKKEVNIDGFAVTFHIMKAMKEMNHGGSHSVMIKVEKDNEVLTNIAVNSKVTHPNDKSESKMMMKMGDWYMVSYDLDHPGKHQVMVLFKTSDGVKHFGGITYADR
ncbi:MAG: hypothetical protein R8J85_08555 [Mariprofundales bacterium]